MANADVLLAVRGVIDANLPAGLEVAPRYKGMTTWVVPESRSPKTRDGRPLPVLSLGERQSYVSLFVMAFHYVPGLRDWFDAAWLASGCPLRRGEVALQLRNLDDIAFDVLAELLERLTVDAAVKGYESTQVAPRR
ncbi:MAG: hypothetical protein QOD30_2405 [Actinomycetota bacterium]|nr:hypothetical protein [Actinomycetota bacterium]